MALTIIFAMPGMAVAQPLIGPAIDFDLENSVVLLSPDEASEHQWSIRDFDDGGGDGRDGAQLRLRLLKLNLKVPICRVAITR